MGSKPFIALKCPRCGKKARAVRDERCDPPTATVAHILCPECVGGDFSSTNYYDANGNEVCGDPATFKGEEAPRG